MTELALTLRRVNLHLLNHANFVQHNIILATLGPATYVTKFLENASPNNVTNNFNSTLNFQNYVLYYTFATLFNISFC